MHMEMLAEHDLFRLMLTPKTFSHLTRSSDSYFDHTPRRTRTALGKLSSFSVADPKLLSLWNPFPENFLSAESVLALLEIGLLLGYSVFRKTIPNRRPILLVIRYRAHAVTLPFNRTVYTHLVLIDSKTRTCVLGYRVSPNISILFFRSG